MTVQPMAVAAARAGDGRGSPLPSARTLRRDGAFRSDIEGLRGVAIVLVVAYHAWVPGFAGGYVGVDVFFVLSGYLITRLLVDEIAARGTVDLTRFYARRARRLVPAAALVVIATVLAGALVYSPVEHRALANTAAATALYASNFWFARLSTDYLGPRAHDDPLLHTWSLGVEEQFYLGWPLLVLLGTIGLGGRSRPARLVAVMGVVGMASFAASVWLTQLAQPWAFFGSPTRAWEFAVGGLACLVPPAALRTRPGLARLLGGAGLVAVVCAGAFFSRTTSFPGLAAMLPAVGTAALLVAGALEPGGGVGKLLSFLPMQVLGRLSYSWYLWHWPLLVLAEPVLGSHGTATRVALACVALGLAAATYVAVENPVRFNARLVRRPWTSLGVTAGLVLVALGTSLWLRQAATGWAAGPTQERFTRARVAEPVLYSNGCLVDYLSSEIRECAFGAAASDVTVVLFGDSHAVQWFPALEIAARDRGWKLVTLTKAACPAVGVEPMNESLGRRYVECGRWRAAALRRIVELRPAIVVMASWSAYLRTGAADGPVAHIAPAEWRAGLDRTLNALEPAPRVVLLGEVPIPGFDPVTCLARTAWHPWGRAAAPSGQAAPCTFARDAGTPPVARRLDSDATAGRRNVSVLDLSDSVCGADPGRDHAPRCRPERDGMVIYKDDHHLSVQFSASLAPVIGRHLEDLVSPAGRAR